MNIDFTKLTSKQLAVFEQVAVNNDSGHPQKTLGILIRKGYIVGRLQYLEGFPPTAVICYSVPIPVHIAWCQWCAEQQVEEEDNDLHEKENS